MFRLGAALLLAVAACSSLEPIRPDEVAEAGTLGDADAVEIKGETSVYSSTWKGLPAGRATIRSREVEGRYETEAEIVTTGIASVFYGLNLRFESESDVLDLLSRRWRLVQGEGEEELVKTVDVRFMPERGRILSVIRDLYGVYSFKLDGREVLDPIGAVYALRRTRLEPGRCFELDLFTEEKLYRATVLVSGRERIRVPAGEFDTILVRADIARLEEGRPAEEPRQSAVWLTDDAGRVPVKADLGTTVGRIVLFLEAREAGP